MKLIVKLGLVGTLVSAMTTGPANGQGLKKIRIGYPSLSFRQSNVWVAKEPGLFNKYGRRTSRATTSGSLPGWRTNMTRSYSPVQELPAWNSSKEKISASADLARQPTTRRLSFSNI